MKKQFGIRSLALLMSVCMLTSNVSAKNFGGNRNSSKGNNRPNTHEQTQVSETPNDSSSTMILIEDESSVENGEMLRASTYVLTSSDSENAVTYASTDDATSENSTVLKYFPVTLYDYDANTINAATQALDGTSYFEGIYFNNGSPTSGATTEGVDLSEFVEGEYYIQNLRASANGVGSWLLASDNTVTSTANQEDATRWTLAVEDGSYYLSCAIDGTTYYLTISDSDSAGERLTTTKTAITLTDYSGVVTNLGNDTTLINSAVQLSYGSNYLCQFGGIDVTVYGGYNVMDDPGNAMLFYKDGTTLVAPQVGTSYTGYAAWNHWNKDSGNNNNGQKTWTGLVESTLDANKDVVFTKPEGGIFDSNADVKSIYTNVELPFVYENGTYTFDASADGVYYHEDSTQSSDGTAANDTRLYFNENTPQSNGGTYGDGSDTVWAPFNDSTSFGMDNMNYHFGMRATIPFTMTSNGRINETNEQSDPIQFTFSGDDDVWVFIDGQLVIDLGGIHNRLDAEIDFAANTVTYSESNSIEAATGSYNDENFKLQQDLFGGLISQDRASFAATDSHELSIFYLERGEGSSNCKIEFNLPMKDTVMVTKHATKSWNATTDSVDNLTTQEQTIVNNIDFGFTLYKSTDNGATYSVVANTNYNLLNANNQVIDTPSTDANGHFYLKNGQSARFVTTFSTTGTTYYVVEDDIASLGFVTPDYNFSGAAAGGFVANDVSYSSASSIPEQVLDTDAASNASYSIKVIGSDESEDSLVFICENYVNANLPNPSALPADDKIVIDYGLGVEIDVLSNDNYRGDSIEVIGIYAGDVQLTDAASQTVTTELTDISNIIGGNKDPEYGTATINSDGTVQYQLTKPLTGVECLTYVVKVKGTVNSTDLEDDTTTVSAWKYGIAKVYIIPATVMYYEEDFTDLITYSSAWTDVGTAGSDNQEPGVVGTHNDSPYGSDAAYLNDSNDSNGTSKHVDTTNGAAQFSYSFTGTGTSFYGRTTPSTGYMRVVVKDSSGDTIQSIYRDTVYLNSNGLNISTLYNIPIFTTDELDYGTYTVTVTVAKSTDTNGFGKDFWLDGIRIYQPLNSTDANYSVAVSAYATDAEANMVNVTLRNKIIREADVDENGNLTYENGNFVVLTDNAGKVTTVEQYISDGPKEEVYLYNGQSVTFSLYDWDPNTNPLYLGMKAPSGSATATVNTKTVTLNNAADCYYEISSEAIVTTGSDNVKIATFTVTAGSNSLISVTNMKVTGNTEFVIIQDNTDIEVNGNEGEGEDTNA